MDTGTATLFSLANEATPQTVSCSLAASYQVCEEIAKSRAANFYPAFLILPKPQRQAMCALYAFTRIADDLADGDLPLVDKEAALKTWRESLSLSLSGTHRHNLFPALADTMTRFSIEPKLLHALIDGVEMDLHPRTFASFEELHHYCYHVASVVGLACIRIWGCTRDDAIPLAESAGVAFQLTNILRDVAEDAAAQRVYLPIDLLQKNGIGIEQILKQEWSEGLRQSMLELADKADGLYAQSKPLSGMLPSSGQAIWSVMRKTYSSLLVVLRKRNFNMQLPRARVSRWRKIGYLLQAVPLRLGWRSS